MGFFSGITEMATAPLEVFCDVFGDAENPVSSLKNHAEKIDEAFKK